VSRTNARWEACRAIAAFCSTTSTATPSLRFSSPTTRNTSRVTSGASPSDGSSSISSFGRARNARARASICCSPPDSVPACWLRRESSHGKYSSTVVRSGRPRRMYAPMRRFSQTVSSAKMPRPSGTCATPARATASGGSDHSHGYRLRSPTGGWTLVDTGLGVDDPEAVWAPVLAELDAPVERVVITHFHPDHVGGARDAAEVTGAPVLEGREDREQA